MEQYQYKTNKMLKRSRRNFLMKRIIDEFNFALSFLFITLSHVKCCRSQERQYRCSSWFYSSIICNLLYLFCIMHPLFSGVVRYSFMLSPCFEVTKVSLTYRKKRFIQMMGISSWYYSYPLNIKDIYSRVDISRTTERLKYWLFVYI